MNINTEKDMLGLPEGKGVEWDGDNVEQVTREVYMTQ